MSILTRDQWRSCNELDSQLIQLGPLIFSDMALYSDCMTAGSQQFQRARVAFAIVAALSILLSSVVATNPIAHAALHHPLALDVSHDHHHDASSSHDHGGRESDKEHGGCFLCEIANGQLAVEWGSGALVPHNPQRPGLVALSLDCQLESLDVQLPPILGPPSV